MKPSNKLKGLTRSNYGYLYTGTKAETPDTAKSEPTVRSEEDSQGAEAVEGRRSAKENLMKQNMLRTQGRNRMQHALQRVRQAADRDRKMCFTSLYHHIVGVDALREAYLGLTRGAAPGVDGVTWQKYGEKLESNLEQLADRLKRGGYRARPVRRVFIPKPDGCERPLGVTALEDKIFQLASVQVLNAIYEVDFLGFSYGFRPGRNPQNALDALVVGIERGGVRWVLDADIHGFFDEISHEWLVKFVEHRVADQRVLRLIQEWLKAGVMVDDRRNRSERGTSQGGSASPLLANVYLHHVFDLWAHHWRRQQGN